MAYETLEFTKKDGVGILTVSRSKALNALNAQVIQELCEMLNALKNDQDLRCLIVTGCGESFVAGADIAEMSAREPNTGEDMAHAGQHALGLLSELAVPTIAAVNGFALGGGLELALACDFIVASEKAKMGFPEVSLGLIPGYGGTQRLARCVGLAKARMMILTGDIYSAQECERLGVAALVVAVDQLMSTCEKLANTIASRSPVALGFAKRAINAGFDVSLDEGLRKEAQLFGKVFATTDKQEGVAAFLEKRTPKFPAA